MRKFACVGVVEPRDSGLQDCDDVNEKSIRPFRNAYEGSFLTAGAYLPDNVAAVVLTGAADSVAFGCRFISIPDLIDQICSGAGLHPYDRGTIYGPHPGHGPEHGYSDQPFLDAEVNTESAVGILDQCSLRGSTICDRCWRRDLDAARNIRIIASRPAVAFLKPLVYRRRCPVAAARWEEKGNTATVPQQRQDAHSGDPRQLGCCSTLISLTYRAWYGL